MKPLHIDDYPAAKVARVGQPFRMEVPVLCTSHFPKDDCDLLCEWDGPFCFLQSDDGNDTVIIIEDLGATRDYDRLSQAAKDVLDRFARLGYRYLRLSGGGVGDVLEGLPTYEW